MKLLNTAIIVLFNLVVISCSSSNDSSIFAPDSVSGKTYKFTVASGAGGFAATGTWTIKISNTSSSYTVTGDGVNVANSTGTLTYSANGIKGIIAFNDSVIGNGNFILSFTSTTEGAYTADAEFDPAANQSGSFVEL